MENQTKLLSLLLISLILFSIPVYAVGSSTGARTNENNRVVDPALAVFCEDYPNSQYYNIGCVCRSGTKQLVRCESGDEHQICLEGGFERYECVTTQTARARFIERKTELREQYQNRNCENLETARERIKCRLSRGESYVAPAGNVPEACRRLVSIEACQGLYRNLRACYSLEGRDKDRCFKRVAEFKKANLAEETESREEKARNYVVALLYDLQERIEKMNENGEIGPDEASALIEKIVDLKEAILSGKSRAEVRTLFQDFRQSWKNSFVREREEASELTSEECSNRGGFVFDPFGINDRRCQENLGQITNIQSVEGMYCCK